LSEAVWWRDDERADEPRRSLAETWAWLEAEGLNPRYAPDGSPFLQPSRPHPDEDEEDEEEAERIYSHFFGFFKEGQIDVDWSNLTMPRRFVNRSLLERASFRNTDLSESFFCWNDVLHCDFKDADLSGCDLRQTIWDGSRFVNARLDGADLRCASFDGCDFAGASLRGALLAREQAERIALSEKQRASVEWHEDAGPEPPGG
jgi:hypothetical protein